MPGRDRAMMDEAIAVLKQGRDLLEQISDEVFSQTLPPIFAATIGSHLRHCLDFYGCFLQGLAVRRIDYNQRERDLLIETDRRAALAKMAALIEQLKELSLPDDSVTVFVRLEDATSNQIWSRSSIAREWQSLQSHTIHHYALIAVLLRLQGIEPGAAFGVSTSTLRHRRVV
ncbi:MAG: hypothetical protein HY231_03890 [Acidobacteria bacterium]|nr:hypothetical protein [Acidobacteriota bacterium]